MTALLDEVKFELQKEIVREQSIVVPLNTDRWVANSLLQKAIRRGEVNVARGAALTFLEQGGSAIWRRLIIIAFEDVGAASPEVAAMTVAASTDASWRKRSGGNVKVATCLARLLAEAPKSRSAEHLITSGDQHPSFANERRLVSASSIADNLDTVVDPSKSLARRALAGWRASGIGWNGDKALGKDLAGLLEAFRQLGVPEALVFSIGVAATASREPITSMVPLVWLAAHEAQEPTTVHLDVPRSSVIDGVPNYALDQHTRTGREAIRELVKYNSEIRECLERYVARPQRNDAAYMAAFYADAAPLARKLIWRGGDELEASGTEADLLKVGVTPDGIAPLLQVFRENVDHLDKVRTHTVRKKRGSVDVATALMADGEG
jgi:MgsA AAA+ ATPase C terminal